MNKLIWICGRPGAGKSTLLYSLKQIRPDLLCLDADSCRSMLYPELGYGNTDRLMNVSVLTEIGCQAAKYGADVVVAAVTPSKELRDVVRARAHALRVELHVVHLYGRERKLWPGSTYDGPLKGEEHTTLDSGKLGASELAGYVAGQWFKQPSRQLFVGRWQPFHTGHQQIILEALEKGPVAIGVRMTAINKDTDPAPALERVACIREEFAGDDVEVFLCPDINSIHIGRAVGYDIVQHDAVPGVSGTQLRNENERT
jgi:cytidyltransferase-like protein